MPPLLVASLCCAADAPAPLTSPSAGAGRTASAPLPPRSRGRESRRPSARTDASLATAPHSRARLPLPSVGDLVPLVTLADRARRRAERIAARAEPPARSARGRPAAARRPSLRLLRRSASRPMKSPLSMRTTQPRPASSGVVSRVELVAVERQRRPPGATCRARRGRPAARPLAAPASSSACHRLHRVVRRRSRAPSRPRRCSRCARPAAAHPATSPAAKAKRGSVASGSARQRVPGSPSRAVPAARAARTRRCGRRPRRRARARADDRGRASACSRH